MFLKIYFCHIFPSKKHTEPTTCILLVSIDYIFPYLLCKLCTYAISSAAILKQN